MTKLQPIDKAPHDGTTVLLYADEWEGFGNGFRIGHFEGTGGPKTEGDWITNTDSRIEPTHFAPLPAKPKAEETAK